MKMRSLLSAIVLSVPLVAGAPAAEEYIPPDRVHVSTPAYTAYEGRFQPPLGRYEYEVSWQGIPAAEAEVKVEQNGDEYHIAVVARTYSAIDLFYRLRYFADGIISAPSLKPIRSTVRHEENSRRKFTEVTFAPDGTIRASREQNGRPREETEFSTSNFTLDPFSAAFLARSLDWKLGETRYFDTFNGRSRYLIALTAADRVTRRFNGELRDAWVIEPRVTKLNSTSTDSKLRAAQIYVSADEARDILKIQSDVFIGSVATKLTAFVPEQQPFRVAQVREQP